MVSLSTLPMSRDCIVCGADNPVGLKVRFEPSPTGVTALVRAQQHFQGFTGVLHGGLVCGLMDDAMWWAVYATHQTVTMTAEITVRYKAPVPVSADLTVQAEVESVRGKRLFATVARVLDAEGKVLAEASGKFMAAPPELAQQLLRTLDH